jgi:hypothetical protein
LKLSSAERPPCKRTGVGSIPTWGSDRGESMPPRSPSFRGNCSEVPTPRSPTGRGARLRPGRFVVRIHAGGSAAGSAPVDATSFNRQDARLLPGACWFDPSRRSLAHPAVRGSRPAEPACAPRARAAPRRRPSGSVLQHYPLRPPARSDTPGGVRGSNVPRSSNGRIFGSEPEDAWFESRPRSSCTRTRPWRPRGLQIRRRGFDSFRPCLTPRSSSGSRMPASQAGDAGSNPARGFHRRGRGVNGSMRACHACGAGSNPAGRFETPGALVLTGNTRGLHPRVRGSSPRGSTFLSP